MGWFSKRSTEQQPDEGRRIQELQAQVNKLVANASDDAAVRQRLASAISGGYDFADTLHNVYADFGYPAQLQFSQFWNMYRRFGIAKNVVELPVDTSWITEPIVKANEAFERDLSVLVKDLKLWQRIKGLDVRQRVGRYAGLFVRVRDGRQPHEPIEGQLPGPAAIMQLIPIYEGQLRVLETDNDPSSETYGQPEMYQLQQGSSGSRSEKINSSFSIHPSRVIVAAEDADDGSIYGVPALEACYNSLMDLRKIIGSGGEGFYKNASQSVIFKLMESANARQNKELLDRFNEQYDDFTKNRARRGLWTPGLEPSVLNSDLVDPKEFFMAALNDVAASSKIPATILIGQQTGRLASTEDSRSFLATINSRRANFLSELVSQVLDWMVRHGALPSVEYEIDWDDLLALSDAEKLDISEKMAKVNREQFLSGSSPPFTTEEIREAAGHDVIAEDDLGVDPELDEESQTATRVQTG